MCRIICFHETESRNAFEKRLIFLKRYFNIVTLDLILNVNCKKMFCNNIVLTFDDCYESWKFVALELLTKYKIHGTFFFTSLQFFSSLDSSGFLKLNLLRNKKISLMGVSDFIEFSKSHYVTIGLHTHSHLNCNTSVNIVLKDIDYNIRCLNKILGKKYSFKYFAYPFGRFSDYTDEINFRIKEKYNVKTFSIIRGKVDLKNDINPLPRYSLDPNSSNILYFLNLLGFFDIIDFIKKFYYDFKRVGC